MGIKEDPEKPGTYIVIYSKRDPVTNQPHSLRRKGIKSLAEARREHTQMIVDIENKIRRKRVPTWKNTVESYLLSLHERGHSARTIRDYTLCICAYTEPWNDLTVDQITTQMIRALMDGKVSTRSVSQQKGVLKMIRGVCQHALEVTLAPKTKALDTSQQAA